MNTLYSTDFLFYCWCWLWLLCFCVVLQYPRDLCLVSTAPLDCWSLVSSLCCHLASLVALKVAAKGELETHHIQTSVERGQKASLSAFSIDMQNQTKEWSLMCLNITSWNQNKQTATPQSCSTQQFWSNTRWLYFWSPIKLQTANQQTQCANYGFYSPKINTFNSQIQK